jgi:hypothetical protein
MTRHKCSGAMIVSKRGPMPVRQVFTASALVWTLFCLALAASLVGVLWVSRRNWNEPIDWDRFMRELEAWSAERARVGRQPFDDV